MRKPLIGIVPLVDTEKRSYWMLPGYMEGVVQAGGLPIMLPLTSNQTEIQQLTMMCDGFLFTGGHDVSPSVYQSHRSEKCGECCIQRDEMETALFRKAFEMDKPILGICRGIQFINAIMGGTLYQDLPTEYSSETEHHQLPPYDVPCHGVKIMEDSQLYDLLKVDTIMVNSYHHQAIKKLAPGIVPMAVSEDGLVEAIRVHKKSFIWAVQWHPEFSYHVDENSRKIFRKFVESVCSASLQSYCYA